MSADTYLGIVLVGGGSSWHTGKTPEEAARKAAKVTVSDWSRLFKFGDTLKVNVYDIAGVNEWELDYDGLHDTEAQRLIPRLALIEVPNPNRRRA